MKAKYNALLKLMMVPVEWNSAATSGIAARIVVDEIGAKKPHTESTHVITTFLWLEKRSYCAASASTWWLTAP